MNMKLKTRILSTFLAVLFMVSSLVAALTFGVSADDGEKENVRIQKKYVTGIYNSPEEKLASMTLILSKFGYELYANEESGEVAMVEIANRNNVLFTNPYDIGSAHANYGTDGTTTGIKEQVLSQVIVNYSEASKAQPKELYSFVDAAMRGQIELSKIRNGVRMEYIIGREEMRKLVPRWIPKESFEQNILKPMIESVGYSLSGVDNIPQFINVHKSDAEWPWFLTKFYNYYDEKGQDLETTETTRLDLIKRYPVLEDASVHIYVLDSSASDKEISELEGWIKDYCMDTYSFEQMDADHEEAGYEATDEEYPVFKLALEYTLSETGLTLRASCNGLQYNMASYTLESISLLPYMGAGNTTHPGYNFYPDGSGSLFDFQQLAGKVESVSAKIYGLDYAYHEITGATYQKTIRMPVFGSVATEVINSYTDAKTGEVVSVSDTVKSIDKIMEEGYRADQITTDTYKRGYIAVIEAGESLGRIQTYHLGQQAEYATLITSFNPKPKDSYDIADSISVTSSHRWTVVSDRKYTGNIRIHYQMLTDAEKGEKIRSAARAVGNDYRYYEASWLGMAEAYRDYLIANKTLVKLDEDDLTADIPLYMEVFGAIKTQQMIATFPVNVMTPLTTFENVLTMYQQLSESGIKNINFKMTGFANGGMYSTMPSKLKWEKNVGGASGFRKLIKEAQEIGMMDENANLGLYPDFDFAYSQRNTATDDLNLKKDAVKTIDNRYSSKRIYSATKQTYMSFFQLAISPSRYSKFYTKLLKNYGKYDLQTMSVSSLGSALNSDFDEDDPYNREDSKDFTIKAFADLSQQYSLMTDSGNAYTWAYVDHIVNADIDSSRYTKSSASVPFLGVVLHGYIQFAGAPLNQEGDPEYMILKSVENGAGMYFILSYQNTSELKEDRFLSRYYSIDYNIWKEDLVTYYNTLNDLLRDVQTQVIIDHKFLNYDDGFRTVRMLDNDELMTQIEKELQTSREKAIAEIEQAEIAQTARIADAIVFIRNAEEKMNGLIDDMIAQNETVRTSYQSMASALSAYDETATPDARKKVGSRYRVAVISALTAYSQLSYYNDQIALIRNQLDDELEIIRAAVEGTAQEYRYTDAKEIVTDLLADDSIPTAAAGQMEAYKNYVDPTKTFNEAVESHATSAIAVFNADPAVESMDYEALKELGVYKPEDSGSDDSAAAETISTTNLVNNNKVVSVSYGDVDEERNKTYYKTFILNYNNFAVRTVYNGQEYTIPAYGYVVIYH